MRMIQGLQVTAILRAGIQLGVFDQIANGNDQVSSIAGEIGADERGTRILLDALAALGLLDSTDVHRLTPLAATFLRTRPPSYVGCMRHTVPATLTWNAYALLAGRLGHSRHRARAIPPRPR